MQPWHRPDPRTRNTCSKKASRFTLRSGAERAGMLTAGGRRGEDVCIQLSPFEELSEEGGLLRWLANPPNYIVANIVT